MCGSVSADQLCGKKCSNPDEGPIRVGALVCLHHDQSLRLLAPSPSDLLASRLVDAGFLAFVAGIIESTVKREFLPQVVPRLVEAQRHGPIFQFSAVLGLVRLGYFRTGGHRYGRENDRLGTGFGWLGFRAPSYGDGGYCDRCGCSTQAIHGRPINPDMGEDARPRVRSAHASRRASARRVARSVRFACDASRQRMHRATANNNPRGHNPSSSPFVASML